jgi:hypothetical protein
MAILSAEIKEILMKNSAKTFVIFMLAFHVTMSNAQTKQQKCETLYERWHQALAAHPILTEPMFFRTNTPFHDLTSVVEEINSNRIAMAYFLCEKMAAGTNQYPDVDLLDHVAGINLWFSENPTNGIEQEIEKNLALFRKEWKESIYKDPSAKVAQLCEARLAEESGDVLNPRAIVAIRRYGIFGLPELVRQIKRHNSKNAFAAYLIITGQPLEYSNYIRHSNDQFTSVAEKTSHIARKFAEMNAHEGMDSDVMKNWSAALAN